jgi:predicted SnoaL-like aldol condensation-catalyzing enzyme
MTKDQMRHALNVIYDQIFNQGQADLLPSLVSGPYIQHNPLFPNGLDGIMGYIKQAKRIPTSRLCMCVTLTGEGRKPLVSISSALIWMARSSSTGMCCNPCLPSPTTPTQCSNNDY